MYLLVEIGKFLEQEMSEDEYPLLRFYRNWVAHSRLNNMNRAKHIPTELNNAIAGYGLTGDEGLAIGWINGAISMKRLRSELVAFLGQERLPTTVVEAESAWGRFVRLLVRVLADVPLVFKGFEHIRSFTFGESTRGPAEERVGSWVIETPGGEFRGDLLLS